MHGDRDLRLLLLALRDRAIDPSRLADAAGDWDSRADPDFMHFLAGRGVISPADLQRLESATTDQPAAGPGESGPHTPAEAVNGEVTFDLRAGAGTAAASVGTPVTSDRYQVIRLHQTGGLGRVWLARDTAVGRDVALKTLRTDRRDSPATQARFVREARVTGQLEHPSIVPLYDLGGGPDPFYVMRFVSGRTLAEAAADYHRRRAAGRAGPLDLSALLDAFVGVCRAVAFAHARDILHRDLKGQNIVLGDFGEVFLLDWGLAKPVGDPDDPSSPSADGDGDVTATGAAVGTPAFMAPEVAAGGAATKAADVYGLGAVLYFLLTGRPPYTGPTAAAVLAAVTVADPAPVAAANPAAPPALAAVCGTAMARNPAARYPSAEELATEVRRWLADEPVTAYREPWPVRAGRWARRRKTAVVAAVVLLLSAVVASTVSAGLLWREEQKTAAAKKRVEEEWARAEREKTRAEGNFGVAWDMAADLGTLAEANETGASPTPATLPARKAVLRKALAASEQFLAAQPDDPEARAKMAGLLRFSGNLGRFLDDTEAADQSYRASIRLREGLVEQFATNSTHRAELSLTLRDHAMFQKRVGRLGEATKTIDRAVAVAEKLPADAGREKWPLALATLDRADLACVREQYAAAVPAAERAAGLLDEYLANREITPHRLAPLFRAMASNRLAIARRDSKTATATALAAHDDAVRRFRTLLESDESADVVHNYSRALVERARTSPAVAGRGPEAVEDLDEAIRRWEALARQHPQAPLYREWLATGLIVRGNLRTPDAGKDFQAAVDRLEVLAKADAGVPAYRALLGEAWAGLARLATDPKTLDQCVDRSLSSYRAARKLDAENPRHARMLDAVGREWPEATARVNERRKAAGKL